MSKSGIYSIGRGYLSQGLVKMYNGSVLAMEDVCIGDKIYSGGIVYGTVHLGNRHANLLVTTSFFEFNGELCPDYNYIVDNMLNNK